MLMMLCLGLLVTVGQGSSNSSSTRGTYCGVSTLILGDKKLHQELKLSLDQVKELRLIHSDYAKKIRKLNRPRFVADAKKRVADRKRYNAQVRLIAIQYEPKLAKILNDQQRTRTSQLVLQHRLVTRPLQVLGYNEQLHRQLKLKSAQISMIRLLDDGLMLNPRQSNVLSSVISGMKTLTGEQRKKLKALQGKKYAVRKLGSNPLQPSFQIAMFKRLDTNRDGKLTKLEAKFLWRLNRRYDKNNDKVLDKNEIKAAVDAAVRRRLDYQKKYDKAIGRS